jgi:hypothetical protein
VTKGGSRDDGFIRGEHREASMGDSLSGSRSFPPRQWLQKQMELTCHHVTNVDGVLERVQKQAPKPPMR